MKLKTIGFVLGGIVICLLPLAWGIFHPGLFVSDDGHWMVIRLSAFYEALSSGQFPVRFLPRLNNGFGYPVADFLYPLFLYIGSFIHLFKIPFVLDVKIIVFLSFFFSGFGMFLFLQKFFGKTASFLGAVLYMYLPYHLYDLYVRGSVGELVSLAIVPFLFWAIERKSWILTAIFIGLLIPAHNTLALFFLPVIILYAIVRKVHFRDILIFTIGGLGLSTFFWFPALFDKQFTVFDAVSVSNPFIYFVNNISLALLGWIALLVFITPLFVKNFYKNKQVVFFLIAGLLSLFFSFSVSSIFWHISTLSQFIQFPFRFLSIALLAETFLGAYILEKIKKQKFLIGVFLVLLTFSTIPYLFPRQYDNNPESFYDTNTATTTVQNEYMPKWVHGLPNTFAFQRVNLSENGGSITTVLQKGTKLQFSGVFKQTFPVTVNFIYFPGWQVSVDGRMTSPGKDKNGLVQFIVPKGTHIVKVWFGETRERVIADIISLVFLIGLVGFWAKEKYAK